MRYSPFPKEFFIENRKDFCRQLKPNSLAIFHSNDQMPKTADQVYPFRQNSDLFYLSGIDQEETILVLFPDCPFEHLREVLFLRKTNAMIAVWEGERLNKEQATDFSGINSVYWLEDFDQIFPFLMNLAENCYVNLNEHPRFESEVPYKDLRSARDLKKRFPAHNFERSYPILKKQRAIKRQTEIEYMKKACQITKDAFERVLKFVRPGVKEYEIEAEITHEFIKQGAQGHAYDPIVASGSNACVLHYIVNNNVCRDGDVILFDFGASYGNYAADMSRVIPVNGRFTERQKEVYNAVLDVFRQAKQKLKPGALLDDYQKEVAGLIEEQLVKLKVLSKSDIKNQDPARPLYKKYFPHGTSHHIGLDVHDVPGKEQPIEAGMVFTCEPGIYLRDEKIGVRLENDMVVTENEPIDLMEDIPIDAEDVESLMNKS